MSDHAKEAAPDPDTSVTAVTNDVATQKIEAGSPTATKTEHGNGTVEEKVGNDATAAESGQEPIESVLHVKKEEATRYRGDSKRNFGDQRDRSGNQYQKRENKSKYDPNAEHVPEDPAERAQLIRNIVGCSDRDAQSTDC